MIVLLVEDDPDLRRVLEIVLENHFEVRSCATSGDALRKLRTERVDVLLIDLDLPGASGEALLHTARTLPHRLAVVGISGNPARLEANRDVGGRGDRQAVSIGRGDRRLETRPGVYRGVRK
jgi:DNA-binding response OmpR family regulator